MLASGDADHGELAGLLERSWAKAGAGLRSAWPPERRLSPGELLDLAASSRFCVLAYLAEAERVHAIPVSFHLDVRGDIWIPAGPGARRTHHLRSHPWAAVVVGPDASPGHRIIRAEGPTASLSPAALPAEVAVQAMHKLRDLSWCQSWLQITPTSLLAWGGGPVGPHSVGSNSLSPG